MKANAPEKIYIHPDIGGREFLRPWLHRPANNESVEYTRTDVLKGTSGGNDGASLIMKERQRQIEVEGFDENHDARENINSLISAAIAYAVASRQDPDKWTAKDWWPWDAKWWKPTTRKRNLEKAGALIAAALDKLNSEL